MSQSKKHVQMMCITAMLIAIGILVPIISPVKFILEPMCFTLGSHVAIMAAMFVSPMTALGAAIGTTVGFYLYGFTLPVVLRALSHVVWAYGGALYLKKHPDLFSSPWKILVFNFIIGVIHALCEVIIVLPMYGGYDASELFYLLFMLVGIGSLIHSMVDFTISLLAWKVIAKSSAMQNLATVKEVRLSTEHN